MKSLNLIILILFFSFNFSAMEQKDKECEFFSTLPPDIKRLIISCALKENNIKNLLLRYLHLKLVQKEFKSILETKNATEPHGLDFGLKIIAQELLELLQESKSCPSQLIKNIKTVNSICKEANIPESQEWNEELFDLIRKKFGGPRWREHKLIDLPLQQVEIVTNIGKEIFKLRKNEFFLEILWYAVYLFQEKFGNIHMTLDEFYKDKFSKTEAKA